MAHNADGKYIGLGVGDSNSDTLLINAKLNAKYQWARDMGVKVEQPYTVVTARAIAEFCHRVSLPVLLDKDGQAVANLATRQRLGAYTPPPPPEPSCVGFSVGGAGSLWDQGYPYDMLMTLDGSKVFKQPIGFDTRPVPMMRGVKTGVDAIITELYKPRGMKGLNCLTFPFLGIAYSMGSIAWCQVLQRIIDGDLQQFKPQYMGSVSFGNPMREENHTFPGGIPVDGEGVVTPTLHNTPNAHWDFISQEGMIGSLGDDMYGKIGGDDNSKLSMENIRAVWKIVATGNPLTLATQILKLVSSPSFAEIEGAFDAAWTAAEFFIVKKLGPHTTYQFIQPKIGDGRDSWEIGRAYCADLVARQPRAFPAMK